MLLRLQALMRFEFLQCIVRIAIAKYVRPKIMGSVAAAVHRFITEDVMQSSQLPPEVTRDPNLFRRKRLYTTEVDAVFKKFRGVLSHVFEYYSGINGKEKNATM